MAYKEMLGILAVFMTIGAHVPYFLSVINGKSRPHIFSWIVWTLLTFIAFAVQHVGGAGAGAWVTFMTGLLSLVITIAALRVGDRDITRADWVMFGASLATIPLWVVTDSPFLSILLVTFIDCLAFGPTFRKAWHKPFGENSFAYGFNIPRHVVGISSLAQYNILTALYPFALLLMNIAMYAMLKYRRRGHVAV